MKHYLTKFGCITQLAIQLLMTVALLTMSPLGLTQESQYNMPKGVTSISQEVYDLHMIIFYICCVIGAIVFAIMFWSMFAHRKSKGAVAEQFHGSVKLEILWTAIPVLILIFMAIPATKTLLEMENTSKSDLTVVITGSQWKWHYKYMDHPVEFYSLMSTSRDEISNQADKSQFYLLDVDKPLVIPSDKKVRFLITSDDVIHAWWVPDFAVKRDAIPGFINESWTKVDEPGIYRGQCAELCGKDHGFMPIVVDVKTPEDFDVWIAAEAKAQEEAKAAAAAATPMTKEELMTLGQKVYDKSCAACHQVSGEGLPGAIPALKGSAMATTATEIQNHINIVVFGKPGSAMQAYGKQLNVSELAAVITYERNAWDNNTGDLVQPADVAAALKKGE